MTERKGSNPRLVNELRHATRAVAEDDLVSLYGDPDRFRADVDTLRRFRLVQTTASGVAWTGS